MRSAPFFALALAAVLAAQPAFARMQSGSAGSSVAEAGESAAAGEGSTPTALLAIGGLAFIGGAIAIIASDDNDEAPVSP